MEKELDSRDHLLQAAARVFARKGYDGATVKELADEADMNVSMVSYYFGGKLGLYRACLEHFGRSRLAAAERVLKNPDSAEDFRVKLRHFIEEFLLCHVEQSDITQIVHRECAQQTPVCKDVFTNVFVKVLETVEAFMKLAQKRGILRADLDAHAGTLILFGGLVHVSRTDQLHKELFGQSIDDPAYRESVTSTALNLFLQGALNPSPRNPSGPRS